MLAPLHVAFIAQNPVRPGRGALGGITRYIVDLATGLAARGHHITVFDVVQSAQTQGGNVEGVTYRSVSVPAGWPAAGNLLRGARALRRAVQSLPLLDVVEATNYMAPGLFLHRPRPFGAVVRCSTPYVHSGGPTNNLWRRSGSLVHGMEAASVHAADLVLANTQFMAKAANRAYRLSSVPQVLHHSIRPLTARMEATSATAHSALVIGANPGRKNIGVVLRAFAQLSARAPDAALHVVGCTDALFEDATCRSLTGSLRDAGRKIHLLGRVDDDTLTGLRKICGVAIIPSTYESFGLPVLEAWSYGQAAIVSDIPALREVGGAAVTAFPSHDATALAGAWEKLLTAPTAFRSLQHAGRARLRHAFDFETWISQNETIYATLASHASSR